MQKHVLFFLSILFIVTSCKNEDDSIAQEQEQIPPNFYALTVGNTWKYEYFKRVDLTDEFISFNVFDLVEITGTTEINGEDFYTFQTTTVGNNGAPPHVPENGVAIDHFRVESGFLLNTAGLKLFSTTNPQVEFLVEENWFFDLYGQLLRGTEIVEVPAGVFPALNNVIYPIHEDGNIYPARSNKYYAEEIGLLKETFSVISNPITNGEKRLVSYTVN